MSSTLQAAENAIESLEAVRIELLAIEATKANKRMLDASYNAVKAAIQELRRAAACKLPEMVSSI